ncbi:hypothetical protein PT110_06945 [Erysipelothrix rhusiopathiae]|nr:hypothetical protein [Erysipelothrix rhusiopathiae]
MKSTNKKDAGSLYQLGFDIWFKPQPVRNLKQLIRSMNASNKTYLTKSNHDGMSVDELVDAYILSNNKEYKNYKKVSEDKRKHKRRYGEYFIIYLGKNISMSSQIKILHEFIDQVRYGERGLPFYATTSKANGEVWIHLWIGDREYLKDEPKVYTKTQYKKPNGQLCGKDYPGAIVLYEKGDIQKDAEGNVKTTSGWRQKKTRIFTESYKTLVPRLKDAMLAVFYCVFKKINPMLKFKVRDEYSNKRKEFVTVSRAAPDWKNIKYREIASLQYFVKYVIHELMTNDIDNYHYYGEDSIDFMDPPTPYSIELRNLFLQYDKIFKSWMFEDEWNQTRNIMFENYHSVMHHLTYLRTMFKKQVNQIVVKHKKDKPTSLKLQYDWPMM